MTQYETKYCFDKPKKDFDWGTIVIYAVLIMMAIGFFGCGVQKNIQTSVVTTDSISKRTSDSLVRVSERKAQLKYREELRIRTEELKKQFESGIVFNDCPPCDSLHPAVPNTVEVKPDGTIKASGNIKTVKTKSNESFRSTDSSSKKFKDSLIEVNELEVSKRISAEVALKKSESERAKEIERNGFSFISLLYGLLVGWITMFVLLFWLNKKKALNNLK